MSLYDGEIKATVGRDHVVWFWPNEPLNISAETPAMTVTLSSGDVTPSVTQVGGTTAISSIANDRRSLTLASSIGSTYQGVKGDEAGFAWVQDDGGAGTFPVKVQSFSGTTARLAEALPRDVTLVDANLAWYAYYATLSSATVTASVDRNIKWVWTYTAQHGEDMPNEPRSLRGVLHVVRQPFATDLTDELLYSVVPGFSQMVPRRQESWMPQRELGKRWIVRQIRKRCFIEDRFQGREFLDVHALITAHYILNGLAAMGVDRTEEAALMLDRAVEELENILEKPNWYDEDDDGEVDPGEEDQILAGPKASNFGSLFDGTDSDFDSSKHPVFSWEDEH